MCMHNITTGILMGFIVVLNVGISWNSEAADGNEPAHGYGLGRAATDQDVQQWNIDVGPTGEGLPQGAGTVRQGAAILPRAAHPVMERRVKKGRWTVSSEAPAH